MAGNDVIGVLVCGAAGRMGSEVVRAVAQESDLRLVAAVDTGRVGEDIGAVAGIGPLNLPVSGDLVAAIAATRPKVMVDFTVPASVMRNLRIALETKVACVVGTTGLTPANLAELQVLSAQNLTPVFIAPNFALGAVLMMEFAARAAKYFTRAEIIELHHDKKLDAPSGTALLTAQKMLAAEGCALQPETIVGEQAPRGQLFDGKLRVHSVRLPGLVAHQEVIFGGVGQTLTLRHDSLNRESFMPGVILAIRKVLALKGLTIGLENLL